MLISGTLVIDRIMVLLEWFNISSPTNKWWWKYEGEGAEWVPQSIEPYISLAQIGLIQFLTSCLIKLWKIKKHCEIIKILANIE